MNISYEWRITALKQAPTLDGLSNVITHVNFEYKGTDADSGESAVFNGACPIGSPDAENFTAIGDLAEEDVITWAQANHPTEHMNEVIQNEISKKITPTNVEVTGDDVSWLATEEPEADPTE
jgi:hypothetical protein